MARRFFRHGELPLVILALLAERPRHGYDLMGELTRRFGPRYRASPGSVYPAVAALESEGLIETRGRPTNGKTVYALAPAGEEALDARSDVIAAVELRTGVHFGGEDSLESLISRFAARLAPLSGHIDGAAAEAVLDRAATDIEALNGKHKGEDDDR